MSIGSVTFLSMHPKPSRRQRQVEQGAPRCCRARLHDYFKKMSFHGVELLHEGRWRGTAHRPYPILRANERLYPRRFSPRARNAFAISLYLAAASLYGGLPKFVVPDDVMSSFVAGHQHFLVELIRTTFARPERDRTAGDPLEPRHDARWCRFNATRFGNVRHQRLEDHCRLPSCRRPERLVKVRDRTIRCSRPSPADPQSEGGACVFEYRLSDLISALRIPVPVDIAFIDDAKLSSEFLKAIEAAVKLHKAANNPELDAAQQAGLTNMVTIAGTSCHCAVGQRHHWPILSARCRRSMTIVTASRPRARAAGRGQNLLKEIIIATRTVEIASYTADRPARYQCLASPSCPAVPLRA